MNFARKIKNTLSFSVLTALFAVAILGIIGTCCNFSDVGTHTQHHSPTAQHEVLGCAKSAPAGSSCHLENIQEVAVVRTERNSLTQSEKNNLHTDASNKWELLLPPDDPNNIQRPWFSTVIVPNPRHHRLLITQLPRAHLS